MKFLNRVTEFFGLADESFQEVEVPQAAVSESAVEEMEVFNQPEPKPKRTAPKQQSTPMEPVKTAPIQEEKKIVNMRQTTRSAANKKAARQAVVGGAGKITILEPRSYSEVMAMAKHILNGESVLINFQNVEEEQARRIVDFLTGTVYAQDGDIKRVGDEIFLCTPAHVEIEGMEDTATYADVFEV